MGAGSPAPRPVLFTARSTPPPNCAWFLALSASLLGGKEQGDSRLHDPWKGPGKADFLAVG